MNEREFTLIQFAFISGSEPPAVLSSISFKQAGQYHGAGVLTGVGLRLRHLAQRNRLPFTAVFGRNFLPVFGMFLVIGA